MTWGGRAEPSILGMVGERVGGGVARLYGPGQDPQAPGHMRYPGFGGVVVELGDLQSPRAPVGAKDDAGRESLRADQFQRASRSSLRKEALAHA